MKDNIPKTKAKLIDKNNPWWNDNLQHESTMQTTQNPAIKKGTRHNITNTKNIVTKQRKSHGQNTKKKLTL